MGGGERDDDDDVSPSQTNRIWKNVKGIAVGGLPSTAAADMPKGTEEKFPI